MIFLMSTAPVQIGADMLDRILAAPSALVALEGSDNVALIRQLGSIARHSGQSIYLWQSDTGLTGLREAHVRMPGLQRLSSALRYMLQSNHFGIYLLVTLPLPVSATNNALLRQLAREPAGHVRRIVLLDAAPALLDSLGDLVVRLDAPLQMLQHPRLRDGRWVL